MLNTFDKNMSTNYALNVHKLRNLAMIRLFRLTRSRVSILVKILYFFPMLFFNFFPVLEETIEISRNHLYLPCFYDFVEIIHAFGQNIYPWKRCLTFSTFLGSIYFYLYKKRGWSFTISWKFDVKCFSLIFLRQ